MSADWARLDAALEQRPPTIWWRDDDAVAPSPQLDRLFKLTEKHGIETTLAVIPSGATEELVNSINGRPITVAVHGWQHQNHAPPQEKKAEFGTHRPLEALVEDASRGKQRIDSLFGAAALSLFVPPWNRMSPELPDALTGIGYKAVSTYAQREATLAPLIRLDAHIDPIDWRGSRSAVSPDTLIDGIIPLLDSQAPIGLMTHHLVHDEAIWELIETLIDHLTRVGTNWVSVAELISAREAGAEK